MKFSYSISTPTLHKLYLFIFIAEDPAETVQTANSFCHFYSFGSFLVYTSYLLRWYYIFLGSLVVLNTRKLQLLEAYTFDLQA